MNKYTRMKSIVNAIKKLNIGSALRRIKINESSTNLWLNEIKSRKEIGWMESLIVIARLTFKNNKSMLTRYDPSKENYSNAYISQGIPSFTHKSIYIFGSVSMFILGVITACAYQKFPTLQNKIRMEDSIGQLNTYIKKQWSNLHSIDIGYIWWRKKEIKKIRKDISNQEMEQLYSNSIK